MTETNLLSPEFWEKSYVSYNFSPPPPQDPLRLWIEDCIPNGAGKSCIEIGCFPGGYLTIFGDKGWEVNGVDWVRNLNPTVPTWLKKYGCRVGEFYQQNFELFHQSPPKTFDLVYSLGFVEHFKNWRDIIRWHCDLVAPGGYLLIGTPNFRGIFQQLFHRLVDGKNLREHYLPSMRYDIWREIAQSEGFKVSFAGPIGAYLFWVGPQERNRIQTKLCDIFTNFPLLHKLEKPSPLWSPYMGLIAQRT
jgi:L-malate glycosyltransferase